MSRPHEQRPLWTVRRRATATLRRWGAWASASREWRDASERFRAEHSRFLTFALRWPSRYPRIPTKRVSDGGFERLLARRSGREWADRWWTTAMDRVDQGRTNEADR